MSNYMQCHRYDQSAISIILEKMFPANSQEYITNNVLDMKRILDINRRPDPNITAYVTRMTPYQQVPLHGFRNLFITTAVQHV